MALNACTGAALTCTFGMAPGALNVLPTGRIVVEGRPMANVMDHVPFVNIPPFGMCTSLANPTVAAATAAALGVLTPMPCVPSIPAPWIPLAPETMVAGAPALVEGSTCQCIWGGVIQMTVPGAMRTESN
jgi:hypothetical protein